ncbi:MAG: hypothetical protein WBL66_08140, partial [Candidatus Acidiferrales bacterium]
MERFRTSAWRKVTVSYPMNAAHANKRAAPLTNMFIHVSFCAIEWVLAFNIAISLQARCFF